ncbi:hypothetical protein LAZ67_7002374 [Cordylochernes scorpioides]|uniref:Reverse transcriptase RNase H-like domain-containing protein n=1 Tax=Cordylochernes scorpioides TaxID=51811 RepID=A0ABY6KN55_9ARAC|nr:hypothetical protein LAZ67_7002374 [Cordylochernes scorpioides]
MLTVAYGEATLDRSNVYRWYNMFSEGQENVNDEECAGRPSTSTTNEKINEVEKMILANRRITVREVAEDLNISIGSCHSIFINDLGMRRVAAKLVPKLLNCDQKQHRMNIAYEMLDSVRDHQNLLQRDIPGDEAGVVHHEFLPQGITVNKEYYLQVMRNLREAIRQKRPDLWKNKNWLLHHDNAPTHTSLLVRDFLAKNNKLMRPQPPYSPDLAPCDFFLFPKLKRPMKGRRYATLDEIKTASKSMKKTRSNTTMIEQTHNQVPQEPTTDSTVTASLRTLTLCLDQLLNRESEETITYDGDEPAAHFFSQLESQPNFHNLEPARQARKALSSLRGEPRKIAQDLALLNKTYEEVKKSLCAVYPRRPSFTLQEFYELKCTSMAEIETYYKNKVRIGLAINLSKSAIVQALSNGVPRNYGNLLKMAQPSVPEEWLCLAQQLTYEGDNTSTKAAQQRSPRQSRTPSTTVDKTPPYPCRYCGGQHWHAQCQQRGPYQRTFRTFTPAVHSVEQPQRSTGPAGVYETAATTSSGETNIRLRALRSYERNYTISELECLAIVECVDKFRVYLLGTRFVIYSDHHALQWLKTIKDPTGRLFRWSLRLSAYDYEVKYLKGSRQYEADLLSRNPFCGFLSTGQIKDHQGELRRDTRYILNDKDLMTIIRRGVTKIIVPPSLRGTLLQRAHRDFNHPGISQMTRLIAAQYYWDGMTNDIRTHERFLQIFIKEENIEEKSFFYIRKSLKLSGKTLFNRNPRKESKVGIQGRNPRKESKEGIQGGIQGRNPRRESKEGIQGRNPRKESKEGIQGGNPRKESKEGIQGGNPRRESKEGIQGRNPS